MINAARPAAKVAILLRTKERPQFLQRALKSISQQSFRDWFVAIIHDGPEAESLSSILAAADSYLEGRNIILHPHRESHSGIGQLLNQGIAATNSEFLAIHDDDDTWEANFLEHCLAEIGSHQAIVTSSSLIKERATAKGIEILSKTPFHHWQQHAISLFRLAEGVTFPSNALFFRRSVIAEIGAFHPQLTHKEDWEFALRLLSKYELPLSPLPLANFHFREERGNPPISNLIMDHGEHFIAETEICNQWLRADLSNNSPGLGWLSTIARAQGNLFSAVEHALKNTAEHAMAHAKEKLGGEGK